MFLKNNIQLINYHFQEDSLEVHDKKIKGSFILGDEKIKFSTGEKIVKLDAEACKKILGRPCGEGYLLRQMYPEINNKIQNSGDYLVVSDRKGIYKSLYKILWHTAYTKNLFDYISKKERAGLKNHTISDVPIDKGIETHEQV